MEFIFYASIMGLGYFLGYFSKGISITITKKEPEVPIEYNNTESLLAPEVRNYYNRVVDE